ncbi:MAG: NUDIX domain-containing protein, partial [Chloroflexota bacterium]
MTEGYFPADRPALTVDVVIFRLTGGQLQTLLVRRAGPPYKNRWAIPGGFVRADEGLDAAARRE